MDGAVSVEPQAEDFGATIESVVGDIRDYEQVKSALTGCCCVFHVAAVVDWGQRSYEFLEEVNYGGTKNVVRACKELGIQRLVFTSTMDTVIPYGESIYDADDEDLTYPTRFMYGTG